MATRRAKAWQSAFGTAEPFMRQAFRTGVSFNEFQRIAMETGISYRRTRMLEDWRGVAGLYKWEAVIARLRPDTPIPDYMMAEGKPGQRNNYLAGVEFTATDPLTGEDVRGIRMISSSENFGHERYESAAAHAYEPGRPYADPTARDFKVSFIYRKRGI